MIPQARLASRLFSWTINLRFCELPSGMILRYGGRLFVLPTYSAARHHSLSSVLIHRHLVGGYDVGYVGSFQI
jgi:hypothetical protein